MRNHRRDEDDKDTRGICFSLGLFFFIFALLLSLRMNFPKDYVAAEKGGQILVPH